MMMVRSKSCVSRRTRHKKILKLAKGFQGRARNCFSIGVRLVQRSLAMAFRGRKQKKREFRSKFISVINAFCRTKNTRYSIFMSKFNNSKYTESLDRKSMALMIQHDEPSFDLLFNEIINETA